MQTKGAVIRFRADAGLKQRLEAEAARLRLKPSEYARVILAKGLESGADAA